MGFTRRHIQFRRRDVLFGAPFVIQRKIAETGGNEFHQRVPQQLLVAKQDRFVEPRQNGAEIGQKESRVDLP